MKLIKQKYRMMIPQIFTLCSKGLNLKTEKGGPFLAAK